MESVRTNAMNTSILQEKLRDFLMTGNIMLRPKNNGLWENTPLNTDILQDKIPWLTYEGQNNVISVTLKKLMATVIKNLPAVFENCYITAKKRHKLGT